MQEKLDIPGAIAAAKQYARAYTENDNGNGGDDWEEDIELAFRAGIEWLASQGKSITTSIEWFEDTDGDVCKVLSSGKEIADIVETFKVDDKIIVQIRKV